MTDGDNGLSEESRQLLRKTRTPGKFCPNCGTKNEADAQRCVQCKKDISWMKIPEPIPYSQAPPQKPRGLPAQRKVFTPRAILVIAIVVALLLGFVLVLVLATRGEGAGFDFGVRPLELNDASGETACPACPLAGPRPLDASQGTDGRGRI